MGVAVPDANKTAPVGHQLHLRGITQRFGPVVAANDITLDIAAGDLVSLLGPSGCGKTTLLKIIAGFQRQSAGDVLVDGQSISRLPPNARQIGIVFQNYALFPHMTVAQNIAYGPQAAGRTRADIAATVTAMLDTVQMGPFRDRLPRQLSGGQQQRVALARCLAIRPRILLLDEPFSALDKNLRLDMQIEVKRLQGEFGITTVLVTHDQEEALGMSDRIAVLSRGDLQQFATPSDIYDRPASIFVNSFVGSTNLLPGELVDKTGCHTVVRLDDGGAVTTDLPSDAAPGHRVVLSVRPEAIRLDTIATDAALRGRVTAVMPIGPSLIYQVTIGNGAVVKVVQDRADALSPGTLASDVFLHVKPGRASGIFPAISP
jgi:putative spermidine/putrescine transport system ATP-binding protein